MHDAIIVVDHSTYEENKRKSTYYDNINYTTNVPTRQQEEEDDEKKDQRI